jgi:hypothetical protein
MDPLTSALQLANTALALATKVWDVTPAPLQQQSAADWAKFTHGIGSFILAIQEKINAKV